MASDWEYYASHAGIGREVGLLRRVARGERSAARVVKASNKG